MFLVNFIFEGAADYQNNTNKKMNQISSYFERFRLVGKMGDITNAIRKIDIMREKHKFFKFYMSKKPLKTISVCKTPPDALDRLDYNQCVGLLSALAYYQNEKDIFNWNKITYEFPETSTSKSYDFINYINSFADKARITRNSRYYYLYNPNISLAFEWFPVEVIVLGREFICVDGFEGEVKRREKA